MILRGELFIFFVLCDEVISYRWFFEIGISLGEKVLL